MKNKSPEKSTQKLQQELFDYLEGRLDKEKQSRMEEKIRASEFLQDTIEGLRNMQHATNLKTDVLIMNEKLRKTITNRSRQHDEFKKKALHTPQNILIFSLVILSLILIIVLCFLAVHYYTHGNHAI